MANKTVSNLNELTTAANSDVLLVETATETLKITKKNLLKEVNEQLNAKSDVTHDHSEYVTEGELNAKGLATENYVQAKIAEAALSGGEVDLSAYATRDYVGQEISKIELTPGPQGERGLQGEQGPKGDKGEQGPQGEPGVTSWNDLEDKPTDLATKTYVNQKIADAQLGSGNSTASIFSGLKATFYGDSLTERNKHYTKGYHSWISNILGLVSYENFGVSGYTIRDVATKVENTTATGDIIFIMAGVNDQTHSKPLGTISDSTSTDTTYGALNLLCSTLREKYPTKLIVYITPHYQTTYRSSLGITSHEISKAIKEVCYLYGICVYDNYQLSGIYPQNEVNKTLYTTDGCHWNDLAHEKVGKNIAKYMVNTFAYVETGTAISITVSDVPISVNEGGTASFNVSLDGQPSEDKTIALTTNNKNISFDKTSLTFTSSNWNTEQTVTISVAEDDDYNNETADILLSGTGLVSKLIRFSVIDNDGPATVPCTSINLNKNALSFTSNSVQTLTATTEPSDTTDSVSWSVSPSGIVTVSNGQVNPVANGNCVITATCGTQTATCSVNVNIQPSTDEPIGDNFTNKTITVTKVKSSGFMHLILLINTPVGIAKGKQINITMNMSNLSNITDKNLPSVSIFTDATGEVSNNAHLGAAGGACSTCTVSGDSAVIEFAGTLNSVPSSAYLKLPTALGVSSVPASFRIDSLTVTYDGQKQEVLKIGGFFAEEICTIE